VLENRWSIRTLGYVEDVAHDLLVIPAGGKLGLTRITNAMSVTATAARFAVEYVPATFGADAQRVRRRALLGVYRVPAGVIRSWVGNMRVVSRSVVTRLVVSRAVVGNVLVVGRAVVTGPAVSRLVVTRPAVSGLAVTLTVVTRPAVGRVEHFVVFLAGPRFRWLGPICRDVATRSAVTKMLLEAGLTRLEVVVRPV